MKLLTFLGLCAIIHLSLAEFGSKKIPPFRPQKDEKGDEVFGIREKRGVFNKIPPIVPEEDDKINSGIVPGHLNKRENVYGEKDDGIDLPLLLKTHRLRPGSGDDIKRIIDDYINAHKKAGDGNAGDEQQPELPGKNLIGGHRHPKHDDEKGHGIYKREAEFVEKNDGIDLPLLLKTHRLRPGSGDDIKRIIDDYINAHKNENIEDVQSTEDDPRVLGEPLIGKNRHPKDDNQEGHDIHKREAVEDENVGEPKLPGKNLIGKNRHPKGEQSKEHGIQKREAGVVVDNAGIDDLPLLLKTHRLRPGSGDKINEIIQKYIKSHKQQQEGEDGNEQPELPGKNLIGGHRHPKNDDEKGHGIYKREAEVVQKDDGIDLPLLLKTHRLRPGSGDDIKRIIDDYINAHKNEKVEDVQPELPGKNLIGKNRHPDNKDIVKVYGNVETSDDGPRLLGEPLIGKNRHPKGDDKQNFQQSVVEDDVNDDSDIRPLGIGLIGKFRRPPVFPDGKSRVVRGDQQPGKVECKDEDRKQVLRCFRGYFKNYDLELVDGKLPTMREIYLKFKDLKDYEKHQKYFKDFSGCFRSTPESCFHADELSKISQQGEEADYLATFFTVSEFSFKSKHNKKIAKCFIKQVEKCAQHKGSDFKECDSAKEIFNEAIEKFTVNCAKFEPKPDDLKTLLAPFLKRTTLGETCPNLISEINV
uniref:Uncharacterized protein n=1 Tax=Panagrolaimus sp. ES5 TaxID=591445 RepID=A0AC34GUM9_9BILA